MKVSSKKTEMQKNRQRNKQKNSENSKILRIFKVFRVLTSVALPIYLTFLIFLVMMTSSIPTKAEPIVEKSHIIIIPEEKTLVIEVLSFSGNCTTELKLDMPESSQLINISGSLNYTSTKIEGNTILFENASVINGSHLALEYSLSNKVFRKKVTFETHKLLVFIPTMVDIVNKSDNLFLKGTALLGRNNYSILEARNLLPGDVIYLKFGKRKLASLGEEGGKSGTEYGSSLNQTFLVGVMLIIVGAILLLLTKRTKNWDVEDTKEDMKGKKREEKKGGKKGWEI